MNTRKIYEIAHDISKDWKTVRYCAKPYLEAMFSLENITDKYGFDTAKSIVTYFLMNASTWRGEKAKAIKLELKNMLKNA